MLDAQEQLSVDSGRGCREKIGAPPLNWIEPREVKVKTNFLAAALAATGLFVTDVAARELTMATSAPEKSLYGERFVKMAAQLEELSGGELTLKVFFGGALGDEQTTLRQTVRGRVDMISASIAGLTLISEEHGLLQEPYIFDNTDQMSCVLKEVPALFGDSMSAGGVVPLSYSYIGYEYMFGKKPLVTPEDFKGQKIRFPPTTAQQRFGSEMGAAVIDTGNSEIIPNLKTGAIDGVATVGVYGAAIGIPKLAPQISVLGTVPYLGATGVSKKVWDTLSDDEKKWLTISSVDTGVELGQKVLKLEEGILQKLQSAGVKVHYPSEEQIAALKEIVAGYRDDAISAYGSETEAKWVELEKLLSSCL